MIRRFVAASALLALVACSTPPAADDAAPRTDANVDASISAFDAGAEASVPIDAPAIDAPGSDAGDDASGAADDAEQRACAMLADIGFCGMSGDASTCLSSLASLRNDADNAGCRSQYDAWVACLGSLTSCPDGSGVLCPAEYSELGACINPPP